MAVGAARLLSAARGLPRSAVGRARLIWTAAVVAALVALVWPSGSVAAGCVGYLLGALAVGRACRGFGVGRRSAWAAVAAILLADTAALALRGVVPLAVEFGLVSTVLTLVALRNLVGCRAFDLGALTDAVIGLLALSAFAIDRIIAPMLVDGIDRIEAVVLVGVGLEFAVLAALGYALFSSGALRVVAIRLFVTGAALGAGLHLGWVASGHRLASVAPGAIAAQLAAALVMAAGSLHPSMTRAGGDLPSTRKLTELRVTVLGLCAAVPWILVAVGSVGDRENDWPVGVCGMALVALLAVRLNRELAGRSEDQRREASLRSGLTGLLVATDQATIELATVLAVRNLMGDRAATVRVLTTVPESEDLPVCSEAVQLFGPDGDGWPAALAAIVAHSTERPWLVCSPIPSARGSGGLLIVATATKPSPALLGAFPTLTGQLGLAQDRAVMSESMHRRHADHRLAALVQNAFDVITILDAGLTVQFQSPSITSVLGHDPTAVVHGPFGGLLDPAEAAGIEAQLRQLTKAAARSSMRIECRLRHRDGSWLDTEITATNLLADPDVSGLVLNIRDVSERRALEAQLTLQAFHDPLTGLANRALLSDRVEHALQGTARGGPEPAVMFIDLDNFKMVNDSLGHQSGDRLLIEIAHRLENCLRPGDTAARMGGDEFAVLLADAGRADSSVLREVGDRVLEAIAEPMLLEGVEISPRASIGIASVRVGSESQVAAAADLVRNADLAMYVAKGDGGGVALYDSSMHDSVRRRLDLQAELVRALEHQEFEVHFQPLVALEESGVALDPAVLFARPAVMGVEALVRWKHPQRGLVGPVEFIPLVEETGQIVELGRWVMLEACRTVAGWARDGITDKVSLTVNVSGRQLQEPTLIDDVAWAIHSTGIDPSWLCIEVTESVVMQDSAAGVEWLQALKQLGVRIAIDDFGTGYSSLAYLQMFPIDVMKVDRSFVIGLGKDPKATELVRAVINLSHSLGMITLAEGIETMEQLTELQMLGCRLGQGYGFARPMSNAALMAALADGTLTMASPGPVQALRQAPASLAPDQGR